MIIVKIFNIVVCRQVQISDYMYPSNIKPIIIYRWRRVNYTITIAIWFKKKHKKAKHHVKFRSRHLIHVTLERILKKEKIELVKVSPTNTLQYQEIIPNYDGKNNIPQNNAPPLEGPYLFTRLYIHINRFYSVPL